MTERYAVHQLLGEVGTIGQDKLATSKVLVVGCGGLAAAVLPYLVAAGVGEITIIDDDEIELSNLNRQVLFTEADVGRKKVVVAQERLSRQNLSITIKPLIQKFGVANGIALVKSHDLVVDCTDEYASVVAINYCCGQTRTPWVYASVLGWDGQVALFTMANNNSPCYKCCYPKAPQHLTRCNGGGVLGAAVNIVGAQQSMLALQYLLGYTDHANSVFVFDLWHLEQRKFLLQKRYNCKFHQAGYLDLPHVRYPQLDQFVEYVLVDVRPRIEWEAGHLKKAVHIPFYRLLAEAKTRFVQTQKLIIYCNQQKLSQLAVANLRDMGYCAFILSGGYKGVTADKTYRYRDGYVN